MTRTVRSCLLCIVAIVAAVLPAPAPAEPVDAQSRATPTQPGGRLERILAVGTMRVCIWPQYYGVTYRNPKSGELSGIDEVLSRAFATDLGVRVEHVDSSFTSFIDDLLSGRCDVAMFGVATLPERAARIRFTAPYLRSDIWAVTTRTHPSIRSWNDIDQPGRVVAVQGGTFMEPVMRERLKHAEILSVQPPDTRERELRSGRADVFMTDYPYSRRVLDNADWARVMAPEQPIHPIGYAYAVAPGDDAWLDRVERFVADIKRDGRLRAAARAFQLEPIVIAP